MYESIAEKIDEQASLRNFWKIRPSQADGYIRNYHIEFSDGDKISIDYNYSRQMVRINLQLADENGREYLAIIKSGTILQEREIASKRPVNIHSRVAHFLPYFRALPDPGLLKAIGGNYDIPIEPITPQGFKSGRIDFHLFPRRAGLFTRLRNYLEKKREIERKGSVFRRFFRRLPAELADISLGMVLLIAYLHQMVNIGELAAGLGFLGVFSGALDWVWRQRSPFVPKVALLLAMSGSAVFFQVQYRVWGIFL